MKKLAKNNKGFSLVELIVVIAIMAVLVGVLAPQLIKYVEKSRQATDIQNCDSIATTLKTYFADKEGLSGSVTIKVDASAAAATGKADIDTQANNALKEAGLNTTKLKGSKWDGSNIEITYDTATGKITYTANSDNYNATNAEEIKPGKGKTPASQSSQSSQKTP